MAKFEGIGNDKKKNKIMSVLLTAILDYEGKPFRAFLARYQKRGETQQWVTQKIKTMIRELEL